MSSILKAQLNIARKKLQKQINQANQLVNEVNNGLNSTDNENIYDTITEAVDVAREIQSEMNRITQYMKQWNNQSQLLDSEAINEHQSTKRNFMSELKLSTDVLSQLKEKYNAYMKMHKSRGPDQVDYPPFPVLSTDSIVPECNSNSTTQDSVPQYSYSPATHTDVPLLFINNQQRAHESQQHHISTHQQGQMHFSPIQSQGIFGACSISTQQFSSTISYIPIQPATIAMPTFSGDILHYQSFMELFNTLIDSQPIAEIFKFYYLKSALQENAARIIHHLPLTSANYHVAWKLLKERFDNTTILRHLLLRKLQEIQPVPKNHSLQQIQQLWTEFVSIFNQLCKIQPDADNTMIANIITSKLPRRYIKRIYFGHRGCNYLASEILEMVRSFIQTDFIVDIIANDAEAHQYSNYNYESLQPELKNSVTGNNVQLEEIHHSSKTTHHPLRVQHHLQQNSVHTSIAERTDQQPLVEPTSEIHLASSTAVEIKTNLNEKTAKVPPIVEIPKQNCNQSRGSNTETLDQVFSLSVLPEIIPIGLAAQQLQSEQLDEENPAMVLETTNEDEFEIIPMETIISSNEIGNQIDVEDSQQLDSKDQYQKVSELQDDFIETVETKSITRINNEGFSSDAMEKYGQSRICFSSEKHSTTTHYTPAEESHNFGFNLHVLDHKITTQWQDDKHPWDPGTQQRYQLAPRTQ